MKKLLTAAGIFLILNNSNAQTYNPAPYCGFRNFTASIGQTPDYISNIQMNALNTAIPAPDSGYVYYNSSTATTLSKGTNYPITIKYNKPDGEPMVISVFIDYNHNNTFDPTETVFNKNGIFDQSFTSGFTLSGNVTIPATALTGITRMRVMIMDVSDTSASVTADPCAWSVFPSGGVPNYGEAIDYNVNITGDATGIKDISSTSPLTLFPNPATSDVYLPEELIGADITIINPLGKVELVLRKIKNNRIDVQSLSPGMFIVRVVSQSGGIYTGRLSLLK